MPWPGSFEDQNTDLLDAIGMLRAMKQEAEEEEREKERKMQEAKSRNRR